MASSVINVNIPISFVNKTQEEFYYCTKRNQGFSGSFGNGKSYGASMKALTLLTTFPKYRLGISRYRTKDLIKSTMATFFKVCPTELLNEAYGGRHSERDGYTRLINGSEILWLHLDDYSDTSLRGLELNSHLGDQMEEVSEGLYLTIDARMERWDQAEIPSYLPVENFPANPYTGKPMPPCYNMVLVNPDTFEHWFYKRYHPDCPLSAKYRDTHAFFHASMEDNPAIPDSLKYEYKRRDKAWVDRYYWGLWGVSGGAIHDIKPGSILELSDGVELDKSVTYIQKSDLEKLLEVIKRDGIKYRVMDHGDAAPTVCLWFAYLTPSVLYSAYGIKTKGIHVCYREYYMPDRLISYHRQAIADLSGDEKYRGNYADPAIFKKAQQKYGGRWSVADEYLNSKIKAPKILWLPADNDEMSTRNAIGELLQIDNECIHPITGEPSPQLLFIKRHPDYPNGAANAISQLRAQKRKKIGSINGEDIYSDERDDNVADHAYDCDRYYAIMPKSSGLLEAPREAPQFSFNRHLSKVNKYRHYQGRILGR